MLNPFFSIVFGIAALVLLVAELVGVARKGQGDTITEHWQAGDSFLRRQPVIRWAYRVFTIGLLVWTALHFVAGVE